ncbi:MAG: glycosyltransferase [Bacteroidetes bacterium]|nr:glycosyltransferase [Bacteroidota bacterium]
MNPGLSEWLLLFFCAASLCQIGVYALIGFKGWKKLPDANTPTLLDALPPISVLICARNEAQNLRHNLPQILTQQYPAPFEVWVINDASTDETSPVLSNLESIYPNLHVLHINEKKHAGKKAALSAGIRMAQHDWLLLTDADCQPCSPYWLLQMAQAMGSPKTELILGFAPLFHGKNTVQQWARYEVLHTAFLYGGFAFLKSPYMGVGRNMAYRKRLFLQKKGFEAHREIPAGDDDLWVNAHANAQNTALVAHPNALMYSSAPDQLQKWFIQKKRHLSVAHHYQLMHQLALAAIAASQVFHYFLLLLLLLTGKYLPIALLGYVLRQIILNVSMQNCIKTMDCNDLRIKIFIYDIFMTLYIGLFVPYQLIVRPTRVSWK